MVEQKDLDPYTHPVVVGTSQNSFIFIAMGLFPLHTWVLASFVPFCTCYLFWHTEYSCFDKGCPNKKVWMTMPIGIKGNKSLALLDSGSR